MIEYFVGAPLPTLDHLVLFSARPAVAHFNYEITVSLKNNTDLNSNDEEQQFTITRD